MWDMFRRSTANSRAIGEGGAQKMIWSTHDTAPQFPSPHQDSGVVLGVSD